MNFLKIRESICNGPLEAPNICHVLPRSAVSNGFIVLKLKQDLKSRNYVVFERVRPYVLCQAFTYLKSRSNFYKDISIANDRFSDNV